MRWIDIILPEPTIHQELDAHLAAAAALAAEIPALQEKNGLDAPGVIQNMVLAGRELFQGILAVSSDAFSPADPDAVVPDLPLGQPEHDALTGYHIVAAGAWAALPWTWLHNGLEFLFEKHPVCASSHGSELPEDDQFRPWMQRLVRAGFLVGDEGGSSLRDIIPQLRPGGTGRPEILFVPGHTDRERRKLIYREAELIEGALEHACQGETLIDLDLPLEPVTPSDLIIKGLLYQAIHFAGPVSQPARPGDPYGEYWMGRLIEETTASESRALEDALGIEGEVLGVDPVTSLLDDIVERYETGTGVPEAVTVPASFGPDQAPGQSQPQSDGHTGGYSGDSGRRSWLLDDGPVHPENLEFGGTVPPLVFSNSYQALPELGERFMDAGASTFIGPVVPLFSRPARIFAGHCYAAMGRGWSAGAAVWEAARICREELGDDHPAWLSYGIMGYGQLALQYL